ncbi:MAG: beta strand repeat-containing protein [Gammaproteobacteria bacterium]
MTISVEARTEIISLVVGMFGAAPGASVLSDLVASVEAGTTISQLAANLSATAEFKGIYPTFMTNGEYAAKVVANLLAEASTEAQAEATAVLTAELNGGMTRSTAMVEAIKFVGATESTNATFGTSAAAFDNKVAVAIYYSVDKALSGASLADLQEVVGGVSSSAATVTTAKASVDGTANTGKVFTLTTSIDQGAAFVGTSGDDTFNALDAVATATFTALDNIDGGAGSDTLNIVQTTAFANVGSAVVKNIETANITSGLAVNVDTSTWAGLTQLNVVSTAAGAETITAATTTGVSVSNSTAQAVNVIGGGLAGSVSTGATGTITIGKAGGGAGVAADANAYTSASIKGGNAAFITDNSGTTGTVGTTLTAVTVDGTAGAVAVEGKAIADLTINNGVATTAVTITNAATADQTLNVTLNKNAAGAAIVDASAKTVNVTTAGTSASTIDLAVAAATALTTAGSASLTLATVAENYTALKTLTINNTGAFSADLSAANSASAAALTSIVASGSTGANTLSIDATKTTYVGGAGADNITVAAAATKTVDGGAGTADVITFAGVGATLLSAASATKFTNFELVSATGGSGTLDVSLLTGITGLTQGVLGGAAVYSNVAAGTGLTVTASAGNTTAYNLTNSTGLTDVLDLTVSSAAAVNTGAITATAVETINVASNDSDTTQHQNTVSLASATLKSIVLTGNAGVALTAANTTITSVDASALSLTGTVAGGAGFTWTSGAVVNDLVVKGSATGGDTISTALAATATKTVAITAYAGTNSLTGSSTLVNTITGGSGADTIVGGTAADVIVGGGGADTITGGAGADKITVSGTTATIVQVDGNSGINSSTTIQTSELTSTFDVVTGASAGLKINVGNNNTMTIVKAAINLAGQGDNSVGFVRGTYDAANGTFTYGAAGADTVMTYDADDAGTTSYESIILVGYVAGTATASDTAGVITLG